MPNFEGAVMEPPKREGDELELDMILSLKDYLDMQKKEALSDPNMYFAGLELGHKPSEDEAMLYYASHGGIDDFRKRNLRHRKDISEDEKKKFYQEIN